MALPPHETGGASWQKRRTPFGTQLQYDLDGTPPFTALTDVKSISFPELARSAAEITHLESTGRWREFFASWLDPGEIGFVVYFHKTLTATLIGFLTSGTVYFWRMVTSLITGETIKSLFQGTGFVSKIGINEMSTDDEGAIMMPMAIKCTGAWSFTAGS